MAIVWTVKKWNAHAVSGVDEDRTLSTEHTSTITQPKGQESTTSLGARHVTVPLICDSGDKKIPLEGSGDTIATLLMMSPKLRTTVVSIDVYETVLFL